MRLKCALGMPQSSASHKPRRAPAERYELDPKRSKLLEAAAEIFAQRGYHAATVREICMRANANIASVNYHFGDKLGLYTEVLRRSVRAVGHDRVRALFDQDLQPDEVLRAVIKIMLQGLYGDDRPTLPFRIMRHELVQPTPALPRVIDEVIRPNYNRMRAIIAGMLGRPVDDETTRLCVHSVMGQVLFYPQARPILAHLWADLKMSPAMLERIADHIADFSLAYIRSVATRQ